tara:strand:- start:44 stop:550 length:507 start_codon:yes stop_codon:yes gene_type:complete
MLDLTSILQKYGKKYEQVLKREVRVNKAVATGDTISSISHRVSSDSLTITFDKSLKIHSEGIRRSGSIPSSTDILIWMKAKNIRPRASRVKGNSKFAGSSERNLKASAFLIARAISRNGTIKRFGYQGSDIVDRVLGYRSPVTKSFKKDLKKELKDNLFNNIFKIEQQ